VGEILDVLLTVIAPIVLVVGAAALVGRAVEIDPRSLSRLVVYLFTPCLVLDGIANTGLGAQEAGQLVGTVLGLSLLIALAAWAVARAVKLDRRMASAFVLTAVLINAGNYGIPVNRFAFGTAGEDRALVFFTVTVTLSNTFGIYLASLGSVSTRRALLNVLKVPLPYAALLGVLLNVGDVALPAALDRSVKLLAQAAVPGMLVLLGLQLARGSVRGQLKPVFLAAGMRLVASPLLVLPLVAVLDITGVTRQVAIVQSAMPTAVISGALASEFGGDTDFVTATIIVSTLLSVVTLSVLLSLLM
jgi:predicted permease